MKAIVLAAGRGSRMGDGTNDKPKCLITVCGKPLLDRCINTLHEVGFKDDDISIVTGYKAQTIKERWPGVRFFHNEEWNKTNMVYSLNKAESWLTEYECCIFYSDIIFAAEAVEKTVNSSGDIVLPYYTEYLKLWKERFQDPLIDLETFKTKNDKLSEIGSRPDSYDQIEGQYMGIIKITPKGWSSLKSVINQKQLEIETIDFTTLLKYAIDCGISIDCVSCSSLWLECDNQNDIKKYEELYFDRL